MTLRIRQIVFAVRDLASAIEQFENILGLSVAYRDPAVATFGLENALLPVGDQFLEIVAPTRSDTAAGTSSRAPWRLRLHAHPADRRSRS